MLMGWFTRSTKTPSRSEQAIRASERNRIIVLIIKAAETAPTPSAAECLWFLAGVLQGVNQPVSSGCALAKEKQGC